MIGENLGFWGNIIAAIVGAVIAGVIATTGYYIKSQRGNWIVAQRISQSPQIKISEKVPLKPFRYWYLWLVILATTACSSQTDSSLPPILPPIVTWILVGLLVISWLAIGVYILIQIFDGIVKRNLTYTLGGVLGFIVGLSIELLINPNEGLGLGLAIIGMYLGGFILKFEIHARGIYAFIIGFLWLGIFYGYIRFSLTIIQEGITWS
jgi:hypothetical protein